MLCAMVLANIIETMQSPLYLLYKAMQWILWPGNRRHGNEQDVMLSSHVKAHITLSRFLKQL